MAGPSEIGRRPTGGRAGADDVRPPAVAGMFYPAGAAECAAAVDQLYQPSKRGGVRSWLGAIVPHAGWVCSGAVAAEAIATVAGQTSADLVVVFGAIHTPLPAAAGMLDSHAKWAAPGGESALAEEMEARLTAEGRLFVFDSRFHAKEHAVEVELPFIQRAWPAATVLPIEVPTIEDGVQMGQQVAREVAAAGLRAVYLASSDLTHYGPNYRFVPGGVGEHGLEWAKRNDERLLRVVTDMAVERVVPEVRERMNACGGGAIAAMLAACRETGATTAKVLRHTNSFEVLSRLGVESSANAVGYAGVVVG